MLNPDLDDDYNIVPNINKTTNKGLSTININKQSSIGLDPITTDD